MVNSSHKPLFDFIASRIKQFLDTNSTSGHGTGEKGERSSPLNEKALKLAFTFSFTYETISLTEGRMLQWDKGWDIPDAIGQDPCGMLQKAIDRLGLRVTAVALTSDSVSTLAAEAYACGGSVSPLAGIIFGTGTNAAYTEKLENITKLRGAHQGRGNDKDVMVINSEWGGWYDEHPEMLPCTIHDKTLDETSTNPNEQLFEKRVSGMYLAELTRLAILKASEDGALTCTFEGSSTLHKPYALSGPFLSSLANDCSDSLQASIVCIEQTLDAEGVSQADAHMVRSLTKAIVRRAARLSGAAIAALIVQSGRLRNITKPSDILFRANELGHKRSRGFISSLMSYAKILLCWPRDVEEVFSYSSSNRTDSLVPENEMIVIGVDGSLFEFYPTFEAEIREALRDVPDIGLAGEARVRFRLTRDGSSLGAALVAHAGL